MALYTIDNSNNQSYQYLSQQQIFICCFSFNKKGALRTHSIDPLKKYKKYGFFDLKSQQHQTNYSNGTVDQIIFNFSIKLLCFRKSIQNIMRKIINLLILLAFIVCNTSSQTTPIQLGGFSTSTNLDNAQFQTVLSFVSAQYPQISNYNLIDAQTQVVSGTNYLLKLQSPQGCETDIKVNVPLEGNMTIVSFDTLSPCQTNTGSYVVQLTPSGYQFQSSLNQALSQNLQYLRSDLVLVETQIASGTNYRFSFRNHNTGYLNQIVIYSPPFSSFSPQNITTVEYVDNYVDIRNDPNQYETPLTFIYQDYPQYQGYKIVGMQKQVDAGTNYKVGLQNNTLNTINYASFLVATDISGSTVATQTSWINIYGYTVQQINEGCTSAAQLHPQINGFTITKINNVWPNEGLMLTYLKDGQQYEVFIYQTNGQTKNIIS